MHADNKRASVKPGRSRPEMKEPRRIHQGRWHGVSRPEVRSPPQTAALTPHVTTPTATLTPPPPPPTHTLKRALRASTLSSTPLSPPLMRSAAHRQRRLPSGTNAVAAAGRVAVVVVNVHRPPPAPRPQTPGRRCGDDGDACPGGETTKAGGAIMATVASDGDGRGQEEETTQWWGRGRQERRLRAMVKANTRADREWSGGGSG